MNQVVWVMTDQRYAYWQTHSNVHGYVDNGAGMPSVLDWQNNIYITQ